MDEIKLSNRFEGEVASHGIFKDIALVVDATDVPIEKPNSSKLDSSYQKWLRKQYYCGREKDNLRSRYAVKYTIAVQISTGSICYIGGPVPGSMNDIRAIRESGFLATLRSENLDEIILADKGYQGLTNCITPIKAKKNAELSPEELSFNEVISSVRYIVECSIGRMKIFNLLNQRYRKGYLKLQKHAKLFHICAHITNISLAREPLQYHANFFLY